MPLKSATPMKLRYAMLLTTKRIKGNLLNGLPFLYRIFYAYIPGNQGLPTPSRHGHGMDTKMSSNAMT